MSGSNVERRFAAILAADVVGYSVHMRADEEATLAGLNAARALVEKTAGQHNGRPFGAAGDAMLVEFASPVEAVRAAVAIQQAMAERGAAAPQGQPMQFRIGINLGDVMVEGENLYGDGVNIASRLEGLSEPGGVVVAEHVRTYVRNKVDYDFEDLGAHKVKNVEERVRAFKVLFAPQTPSAAAPPVASSRTPLQLDASGMPRVVPVGRRSASGVAPAVPRVAVPSRAAAPAPVASPVVASGPVDASGLEASLRKALTVIERSPRLQNGAELPWFLTLGDETAGVRELLEAVLADSPFAPPEPPPPGQPVYWDWWFFSRLVVGRTGPGFVGGFDERERTGAWQKALGLLKQHRDGVALNGIVVCLSQRLLAGDEQTRRDHVYAVRRLLDVAAAELGIPVPVTLLVTRVDRLPGFDAFMASLPPGTDGQALGHLIDDPDTFSASADARTQAITPILARLQALRLGMLRQESRLPAQRGVFEFTQGFLGLAEGLEVAAGLLAERNALQHAVQLRGLYFVGTGGGGAFASDLFSRFLPQDHGLVHQWLKGAAAPAVSHH